MSKAFLDALYAILDGLVHLASEEWSTNVPGMATAEDAGTCAGTDLAVGAPALDLRSTVGFTLLVI